MIPAGIHRDGLALHDGERIPEQGHAQLPLEVNAVRPLQILLCKHSRQIFLVFGKHAHAEPFRIVESLKTAKVIVQTNQNEKGSQ